MPKDAGPALYIYPGTPKVPIAEGVQVPERFSATYVLGRLGRVDLEIETTDKRSRVSALQISEAEDGAGITGLDLKGTPAQDLLTRAVEAMAWIAGSGSDFGTIRKEAGTATRRKPDQRRLQEVADAFAANGLQGIMDLGVGDRQARRLKRLAVEEGLLKLKGQR